MGARPSRAPMTLLMRAVATNARNAWLASAPASIGVVAVRPGASDVVTVAGGDDFGAGVATAGLFAMSSPIAAFTPSRDCPLAWRAAITFCALLIALTGAWAMSLCVFERPPCGAGEAGALAAGAAGLAVAGAGVGAGAVAGLAGVVLAGFAAALAAGFFRLSRNVSLDARTSTFHANLTPTEMTSTAASDATRKA